MQTNDFKEITTERDSSDYTTSLSDLFFLYLSKWYLFVICVAFTIACAYIYLRTTSPIYTRTAEILIKNEDKGGSIAGLGAASELSNLGLTSTNTNVANEIRTIKSLTLATEVVNLLKLNVAYYRDNRWFDYDNLLYGSTNPIEVEFDERVIDETHSFKVQYLGGDQIQLSDFRSVVNEKEVDYGDGVIKTLFGESTTTPIGDLTVSKSIYFEPQLFEKSIKVEHSGMYIVAQQYVDNMGVTLSDKGATTIILTLNDMSTQRADDYINTLISIYNENWVKDKNQISISTDKFIEERLTAIASSLGDVDEDISTFKSENKIPDIAVATTMFMEESSKLDAEMVELNNQIAMTKYIRDYLVSDVNKNLLLPVNSGVDNANIAKQIDSYNDIQLQRNRVVSNSSTSNPIVVNFDRELSTMRDAIITSINNHMATLQTRMSSISKRNKTASQRIIDNPKQAKELLTVSRQQAVMEAIYLYLLQKREENQLTQAFTAYNTRLINLPNGSPKPTSPNWRHTLLIALIIGLFFPAVAIYLAENMVTVVRGRKDVEGLKITFLGEIPQSGGERKYGHLLAKRFKSLWGSKSSEGSNNDYFVVKPGSRNIINEAFRIIRTNIEFILRREQIAGAKVIMTTSLVPNSGKTFISINLAASIAIKGSRVLIIDLDIRKATISNILLDKMDSGITNYLNYSEDNLSSLIHRGLHNSSFDLLPVGTIPPNPTELLTDNRLNSAFKELREEYDYIIVDAPPSEVVADVSIINNLVDMTLYIARVGNLERAALSEIDRFYVEQRYKNIALILNGSGAVGRHGYGKYGYGYGYGYGSTSDGYTVED